MVKKVTYIFLAGILLSGFQLFPEDKQVQTEAQDPLRGTELKKHLTGPEVAPASLKGKVVFFEYWGFG
ncbi:MAG: hypothetical protein WAX69_06865 [Victivallales bacterium]